MFLEEFLNLPNGTSLLLDQVEEKSSQETSLILKGKNDGGVRFERRAYSSGMSLG